MTFTKEISMSTEVVLIDGVRTPIGKFMGRVSQFSATELGAHAIKALKERNKLSGEDIDEVIMGNVVQAGVGQAPARIASIKGGISSSVPAFTINKVCGSGLKAVMLAAQSIKAGDASAAGWTRHWQRRDSNTSPNSAMQL